MAIYKLGQKGRLTNKQIKEEIMNRLGLDAENKEDQAYYKKQYNLQRLKTVNFSTQQNLDIHIRPNENWLRTLRKEQSGAELSAIEYGIKTTSTQNTALYRERVKKGKLDDVAIKNLERQFHNFLTQNTKGYQIRYEQFKDQNHLVKKISNVDGKIVYTVDLTLGEVIPPEYLDKAGNLLPEFKSETMYEEVEGDLTFQDHKDFLEKLADELHAEQDAKIASNRALYKGSLNKKRKQAGS